MQAFPSLQRHLSVALALALMTGGCGTTGLVTPVPTLQPTEAAATAVPAWISTPTPTYAPTPTPSRSPTPAGSLRSIRAVLGSMSRQRHLPIWSLPLSRSLGLMQIGFSGFHSPMGVLVSHSLQRGGT
jgi:hypothetical protein